MTGVAVQHRTRGGLPRRLAASLAASLAAAVLAWGPGVKAAPPGEAGALDELQTQVRALSEALATLRAENDLLKARLDRREHESVGGSVDELAPGDRGDREHEFKVLDVNRGLGMAVLNAGRRQGIRPGMTFAVMQGDRSVATLRVVDARGRVAGAVIEAVTAWRYPEAQDRAIRVAGIRE